MKKTILSGLCLLTVLGLSAQKSSMSDKGMLEEHYLKYERAMDAQPVDLRKSNLPVPSVTNDKSLGQTILELTDYDLQTNAGTQDRIAMDTNGNISVVWTASSTSNATSTDRGSGYSFYDGSSWNLSPSYPRIETVRCGWPTILYAGSGDEIVLSHSTEGNNAVKLNSRPTIGSGAWTQKDVVSRNLTWQRAAMGGPDGNTIHMVAITDTLDSTDFQGMRRALAYYRSKDGGSSFDVIDRLIPGLDSTMKGSNVAADQYAIAANGNVVAIAVFRSLANDVFILKSTDNGDNWTKTIVYDYPYADFDDFDNNFATNDTNAIEACDGSGAILLDDNDVVHVAFGRLKMTNNDSLGDGIFTRQIFVDSLIYWNESMGAGNYGYAGAIYDANENGNSNLAVEFVNLGDYRFTNIISQPSMGMGEDGKIWMAYSALTENYTDQSSPETNLRHIFVINSDDNGSSWSEPVDLNLNDEFFECVYPSIAKRIDDKVRLVYQRDFLPSVSLVTAGTTPFARHTYQTSVSDNDIVYYEISTLLNVGVEKVMNNREPLMVYPNPATDLFNVELNLSRTTMVKVSLTNIIGKEVINTESMVSAQQSKLMIDASGLSSGIYLLNVQFDGQIRTAKLTIN